MKGMIIGDIQMAEYLNVTKQTIKNWKKKGWIPYHQIGRICYYNAEQVDHMIGKNFMIEKKS